VHGRRLGIVSSVRGGGCGGVGVRADCRCEPSLRALPCLSSAGSGWGLVSLDRDVKELRGVVTALRRQGNAPGSSLGSQLRAEERALPRQANRPSYSWATLQAHKTS
jgi:hypothetical protein